MKIFSAPKLYTFVFGLFLGLCVWKFGNPVILDHKILPPKTFAEFLNEAWPPHWAKYFLVPLALAGAMLIIKKKNCWPAHRWLLGLPLAWLGWQFLSAMQTVDGTLTGATLWQFAGVVACYLLGIFLFAREKLWRWLLPGVLAAFTVCLVRAVDQKLFDFPAEHHLLIEGERAGWTNFPPAAVASMKLDNIIVTTNGVEVANPVILKKMERARVYGTLVYPNALAGLILLLWPLSLALAAGANNLRPLVRMAVMALAVFLGGAALFWSGSKLGWLIGILIAGFFLLRLEWSKKMKLTAVVVVLVLGLGVFAVRFQSYFSAGATSAGARLDYWRAAVQTAQANPVFGTGPGTFQRPYARLKTPEQEMARLTHNDFLEQFSDSGIPGGLAYAAWIALALAVAAKKIWHGTDWIEFALFAGVLAWLVQGLGEFSLYIPALAWMAFTFLGVLSAKTAVERTNGKKSRPQ